MIDFPAWFMALPPGKRSFVARWQNHRAVALTQFTDGRMSEDTARRIIAKCNRKIEKLTKGARLV